MNAIIEVSSGEIGSHNWSLNVDFENQEKKSFYLGQDGKFCSRMLGMQSSEVVRVTGISDLRIEDNRKRLANFIIDELELNEEKLKELEPWELCCQ